GLHDDLEDWLVSRSIRVSHHSHKWFRPIYGDRNFPTREASLAMGFDALWDEDAPAATRYPVAEIPGAGMPGWRLPHVALIDTLGLSDKVVARTPVGPHRPRAMAHERRPPRGYVACFRPNVRWGPKAPRDTTLLVPRPEPLTADEIRDCEQRFLEQVVSGELTPRGRRAPGTERGARPPR
ncbi:MAG: hypothetical protein KC656_28590, partial [Myxococcales bacterium]|nr:hypothetical protein [Myxococcales bacterium]